MDRRDFIKQSCIGSIVACVSVSGFSSCRILSGIARTPEIPPEAIVFSNNEVTILLNKVPELKKVGIAYKLATKSEKKLIIVHSDDKQAPYKVFENSCSHGGSELELSRNMLRCPSFGHSKFDLKGEVLKGPAQEKIRSFPVNLNGDKITVDLT